MKCPHCDHEIQNFEIYQTEWENRVYYDYCMGECLSCNKKYEWTEVSKFDHVEDFHETN